MLRSLCLPLLGLALVAQTAAAQTTPTKKPATTPRPAASKSSKMRTMPASASVRRNAKPAGTSADNAGGMTQSGYAAPGEPIQDPRYNGKNTPPYDGAAPAKRNTTLSTPK